MAHELTMMLDGRYEMAYRGETPWHDLGQTILPTDDLDTIKVKAGMDWSVKAEPLSYLWTPPDSEGESIAMTADNLVSLHRSDTGAFLGQATDRYQIVHPHDSIEFFRDVTEVMGGTLETCGTLQGGRKFWALARISEPVDITGTGDAVAQYLLLSSSADGQTATEARETAVRVVCANTLAMAQASNGHRVKLSHRQAFNPDKIKRQLASCGGHWSTFVETARALSQTQVTKLKAAEFVSKLLAADGKGTEGKPVEQTQGFLKIMSLFDGSGQGATLQGVEGTAWGLLNAVTEYVDHHARATGKENRLKAAWFGAGGNLKDEALDMFAAMV